MTILNYAFSTFQNCIKRASFAENVSFFSFFVQQVLTFAYASAATQSQASERMPPKEVNRQTSELPNICTDRAGGSPPADPNVIPEEDLAIMKGLGVSVGSRLKRGRYGVVYEGHFTETFSVGRLNEAAGQVASGALEGKASAGQPQTKTSPPPLLHYLFVRPEQTKENGSSFASTNYNGDITFNDMQPGRKFALKFCDTELRKAYHIDDVEQRLQVRK